MRRLVLALSVSIAACAVEVAPAYADHGPVLVVPGRMGITINGRDASYAVIEGDWGLSRPGHGTVTVIYPRAYVPAPSEYGYFPHTGKRPRAGRLEIEPPANRRLPPRAESFQRVWTVGPEPEHVEAPPAYDPPPVIVAPDYERQELLRRRN